MYNRIKPFITNADTVKVGSRIIIESVFAHVNPSPAFPDGIDHQAKDLEGKTGLVTSIDDSGALRGTWGSLSILPEVDQISIIH